MNRARLAIGWALAAAGCASHDAGTTDSMPVVSASHDSGTPAPVPVSSGGIAPALRGGAMSMNECGLSTGWAGDEYCILPPPPDQGFQLHIGPTDYGNPEPEYVLKPNEEVTTDFASVSGNDRASLLLLPAVSNATGHAPQHRQHCRYSNARFSPHRDHEPSGRRQSQGRTRSRRRTAAWASCCSRPLRCSSTSTRSTRPTSPRSARSGSTSGTAILRR